MENQQKTNSRIHRVGSITTGLSMVVFGVLFLLHIFGNVISYETIFKLWPVILIGLGIEILLSNLISKKFVYDKGAVVLLILMVFLSVGMACTDVALDWEQRDMEYEYSLHMGDEI